MNEEIKLRYIKWNQSIDKLMVEMKDYSINPVTTDIINCCNDVGGFAMRLKDLKVELEDIIDFEDVEDFLENGSGLLTTCDDVL